MSINLKKEQTASRKRPRYPYSFPARFFFGSMDRLAGKKTTLAKAKLIEMLASIPYRAWEFRQYARMTRCYRNPDCVRKTNDIVMWSREAQDNEYWHLIVIHEKMKEDGIKDPWYLFPMIPFLIIMTYVLITRTLALINIRRAYLFNAEFEDHAEHTYAEFVEDHPHMETEPVNDDKVKAYCNCSNWADVFRRIGLDERDHMNNSFVFCGKPELMVKYEGMPDLAGRDRS